MSDSLSLDEYTIKALVKNSICKFCNNSREFDISIQESTKYRIYGLKINEFNELEREIETDETYQLIIITCGKCRNLIKEELERF